MVVALYHTVIILTFNVYYMYILLYKSNYEKLPTGICKSAGW